MAWGWADSQHKNHSVTCGKLKIGLPPEQVELRNLADHGEIIDFLIVCSSHKSLTHVLVFPGFSP